MDEYPYGNRLTPEGRARIVAAQKRRIGKFRRTQEQRYELSVKVQRALREKKEREGSIRDGNRETD